MINVKITYSKGRSKGGKLVAFVRPDYYCFNRSRRVTGLSIGELKEAIETVVRKWCSELFVYEVGGETIVSNNERNALTEFWRVCNRDDIGKMFEVKIQNSGK